MDVEVPVFEGYLNVPAQTGFSLNRISKKKSSSHKHCILFKASRHGIERLEICDKDDNKNAKIITLENCVKITQQAAPANLIHVVTKTGTLTLNALNEDDLKKWVSALQNVAFKSGTLTRHSVIEEDNDLYCTSYSDGIFTVRLVPSDVCVKCNLEAKMYLLNLTATDLQLKNTPEDTNQIIIVKWPYRYIRKYGYRDGKLTFEAGRKCDTGEGVFSLEHTNPQEIFRCMAAKMKSMKKLISGDSVASIDCGEHQFNAALSMEAGSRSPLPPSPNPHNHLDNDLNQSTHLLRGFLSSNDSLNNVSTSSSSIPVIKHIPNKPPRKSITERSEINDRSFENRLAQGSTQKFNKFQNYGTVTPLVSVHEKSCTVSLKNSSPCELNKTVVPLNMTETQSSSSITSITGGSNVNCISNSSKNPPELPVRNESKMCDDRDYESIETITNAWKTMGIDDIKHTEHVSISDENSPQFVWLCSQSQRDITIGRELLLPIQSDNDDTSTCTPSTISASSPMEKYDRLQFFAPSNSKASADYKTIVTITPPFQDYLKQTPQILTTNDYEIIGSPDIQSCRLADDSYIGYGVLRKPSTTQPQTHSTASTVLLADDDLLDHRRFNGLEYAIVSKPKRV